MMRARTSDPLVLAEKLTWYIRRPSLYAELIRKAQSRIGGYVASRRSPSGSLWCQERGISTEAAIRAIAGPQHAFVSFTSRFSAEFTRGTTIEARGRPLGGAGNLDLLYNLCESLQASRCLETGVASGWSSLAILCSLSARDRSELVSIDMPYAFEGSDLLVGQVVPAELRRGWTLLRRSDRNGLPLALQRLLKLDLCHYDSDKSASGKRWALPLIWSALRRGGILVCDDVGDDLVFSEFSSSLGRTPVVVNFVESCGRAKYQGILVK